MRGDRFSLVAGLVAMAVLLLAGCSNEPPTTPAAPAPTGAPTPSPTEAATDPADQYAIPDDPADIDEDYVERVLEALSESTAAAAREVARSGRVTPQVRSMLASSYRSGDALDGVTAAFKRSIRNDPADEVFNPDAQSISIEVKRLLTATPSCVFVRVLQDTSDLIGQEIDPLVGYFHIEPKRPDEDPDDSNRTPWMIVAEVGPPPEGQEYDDPCT